MKYIKCTLILILLSFTGVPNICSADSTDITILYITDVTIKKVGSFPFTRDKYGSLITEIYKNYSPECVYFDIIFTEKSKETPELDTALFSSISGKKNLFFTGVIINDKYAIDHTNYLNSQLSGRSITKYVKGNGAFLPVAEITKSGARFGISNVVSSPDGYIDRYYSIIRIDNYYYYSSPLILALYYLDFENSQLTNQDDFLSIGGKKIRVDKNGGFLIDFDHKFNVYEYHDIFDKKVPRDAINGKIVIIGINYTGGTDYQPTRTKLKMPGPELTAHATQTLIDLLKSSYY